MSVTTYLRALANKLNIAENESDSIERSISTLSSRALAHFGVNLKEHFRFGSSVRKTMLPRRADSRSDVDYMFVLDNQANNRPQTLIDRLKVFANSYYGTSEIYQSNPTVVLELNHIKFDLVPSFRQYDGASLQIPAPASSLSEWIYTYPLSLNSSMDEAHKRSGYELKPALRLLKYWNAHNGYIYNSFPLEEKMINAGLGYYEDVKLCFFAMIDLLASNSYSLPDYKKVKVDRAKKIIDDVRDYERRQMPVSAELEMPKILPDL